MRRPPRDPRRPIFSATLLITIGWQGTMLAAISLSAYAWALGTYGAGAQARTIALLTLVGVQVGHTFNCRSRVRSAFRDIGNPWVWYSTVIVIGLQTLAVMFAPLARILGLARVGSSGAAVFALAVLLPIVIVETQKAVVRSRLTRAPLPRAAASRRPDEEG